MDKKNKSSFSLFNVEWDFPVLTDEEIAAIEYAMARYLIARIIVFIKLELPEILIERRCGVMAECMNCGYCKFPRKADDNGGACKCKIMKYKTIDVYVGGGETPEWCPLNTRTPQKEE